MFVGRGKKGESQRAGTRLGSEQRVFFEWRNVGEEHNQHAIVHGVSTNQIPM
jgi:hypothetical protein